MAVTVTAEVPTVLKLPSETVNPTVPVFAVQLAAMVALTLPLALLKVPRVSPALAVGVLTVKDAAAVWASAIVAITELVAALPC